MNTGKGMLVGLIALVACPCHLPLTLPVLLMLTGGTAVGGWLAANQWFVWLGSGVLFVGGLVLMIFWMYRAGAQCVVLPNQSERTQHEPSRAGNLVTTSTKAQVQSKESFRV